MTMHFYTLNALIFHPLLSPLISSLFLFGLYRLATMIVRAMLGHEPRYCEITAGFVVIIGLFSSFSYLLSSSGTLWRWAFRTLGYPVCAIGLIFFWNSLQSFWKKKKDISRYVYKGSFLTRIDRFLLVLMLVSLCCIVAGPPTDADSLNYHLGIPLDIINKGFIPPRPDWLYYHLIGLGEFWNLFGLELGTDNLGSFTQYTALLLTAAMIAETAVTENLRLFGLKLVVSTPAILFLATGQKPQLIGTAAILASLLVIVESFQGKSRNKKADVCTLCLSLGALFFAFSIKYSFFLIGSGIFVYSCFRAFSIKRFRYVCFFSVVFYGIFLLPLNLHKYLTYGDPFSPVLLSIFKPNACHHIVEFYSRLKSYSEGFGLPLGLLIPKNPGIVSTVLGLGIFSISFAKNLEKKSRTLLALALYGSITNLVGGQHTARFFIEAHFLLIASFVLSLQLRKYSNVFSGIISAQLAVVSIVAVIGAGSLFPGALTWKNRIKVMEKTDSQYTEMEWLDKNLPQNAFIVSELFANLLMPRPFLAHDYNTMSLHKVLEKVPLQTGNCYLATEKSVMPDNILYGYIPEKQVVPIPLWKATRNPFNTIPVSLYVYRLMPK